MKICSNTKPHKILNQKQILFDVNTCGSNQCYECIADIFHSSLTRSEGQDIQDELALDCGCVFRRDIILNFLNQQCFKSIGYGPDRMELRNNKILMRHPVKIIVSKKKWQEKIENIIYQQQQGLKDVSLQQQRTNNSKQIQQEQFYPVQTVSLNCILSEQKDKKQCRKCQFTVDTNNALTFIFGNNINQHSYICLNCFIWKQWNDKPVVQQIFPNVIQTNLDKIYRKPRINRLLPIVFNKTQEKTIQSKPLFVIKDNEPQDNL